MKDAIYRQLEYVREASRKLCTLPDGDINDILIDLADRISGKTDKILEANQKDLDRMYPSL